MSNEKFTKGPWRFVYSEYPDGSWNGDYEIFANKSFIAGISRSDVINEADANAALIAAAPEMYAMLEKARDELLFMIRKAKSDLIQSIQPTDEAEPDYYDEQTVCDICKLLAKARGEV